jgi:RNA polymerase sigma factor (sigma-70 family)
MGGPARRLQASSEGGDEPVWSPTGSDHRNARRLDEALDALARIDPRKSRVVELRYFVGLSIQETSDVLGVSVDTVQRDWRMARAWLFAELAGEGVPSS